MGQLSAFEEKVLKAVEGRAALASRVFQTWSELSPSSTQTVRSLIDASQLGVTEELALAEVLAAGQVAGMFEPSGSGFRVKAGRHDVLERLAFALEAIDHYRSSLHRDESTIKVVLTKPPQPSLLERHLEEVGWRTMDIEPTNHAFVQLVQQATSRTVVMTPFLDLKGASWLKELFSQTAPGVARVLILRSLEAPGRKDFPEGYSALASWFEEQGIEVYNYSLSRPNGVSRETFHAKVVLCDRSAAYLGSSNMTEASLDYSMEMGVLMTGRAAAQVADVVDAVLKASRRFC